MLDEARRLIEDRDLPGALRAVRNFIGDNPYLMNCDELRAIEDNLDRMASYMLQGFSDPAREDLYNALLHRLWLFAADAEMAHKVKNVPLYASAARHAGQQLLTNEQIQSALEGFVGDIALADIDSTLNAADLYTAHYRLLSRLFDQLVVSPQWRPADSLFFGRLLPSPTIETADAQLLVSAVTLACISQFDIHKLSTLHAVCLHATAEAVRQRALVGFVLCMPHAMPFYADRLRAMAHSLCSDERRLREVIDLQKQIALCMNAERDHELIQRDIIPTLIKNNNLSITRDGIVEKDDDPMDDILGTGAADRRMEEMERGIQQMMQMQRAGSDIYFGGFSQMKRFPFFYTLSNWFTPFSPHHPDLGTTLSKLGDTRLLDNLLSHGPFCDSDKYSFAIAMGSIVDKMPPPLREMLDSAEALGPSGSAQNMTGDGDDAAYMRRMYLQDLYRFFRLYPQRSSITGIFDAERPPFVTARAFVESPVSHYAADLAAFYNKQHNGKAMGEVLSSYGSDDPQHLLLSGIYHLTYKSDPKHAITSFQRLGDQAADDESRRCYERCLPLLGRAYMQSRLYDRAEGVFAQLCSAHPDSKSYALNHCAALANQGKYEQAANIAYRLDIDHHDDVNVLRLLAWTLMGRKELAEADRHYGLLLAHPKHNDGDLINAAYCRWFMGDIASAADLFRQCGHGDERPSLVEEFANDRDMLALHGVSDTDCRLMIHIVKG